MAIKLLFSTLLLICVTLNCCDTTIIDWGISQTQPRGVVDPITRCGGVGTFRQFRISDCDGHCQFYVGTLYNAELDFIPSIATPALNLRVELCIETGFCGQVMDFQIPNSSVQPGIEYTLKYQFVPNDQFLGQPGLNFINHIYRNITGVSTEEVCIGANIDILPYRDPTTTTTTTTTTAPPTTTTVVTNPTIKSLFSLY